MNITTAYRRWRHRHRRLFCLTWTCCHLRVSTVDACPTCGRVCG